VNNAIRHGRAHKVTIALKCEEGEGTLVVADDGTGFTEVPGKKKGMGLHIMRYRATGIGATLTLRPGNASGTVVTCTFPMKRLTTDRGNDGAKG
jgi:signal transduction histidine kinase